MKNFLLFGALIAVIAWLFASFPEVMKKQEIKNCWDAREICEKYWDVHEGNCSECRKMKECYKKRLFND